MKFGCSVLVAFAALVSTPASAAIVIDQDAFVAPPSGAPTFGWTGTITGSRTSPGSTFQTSYILGQTVTAGQSGALASIELQYAPTILGLALRLYDGDLLSGGALFGAYYFSGTRFGSNSVSFDLSSFGYRVQPGQRFSFDLFYDAGPNATAFIATGTYEGATPPAPPPIVKYANYADGTALIFINGVLRAVPRDLAFRTLVDTTPMPSVPESATWAMMLIGFGLVGMSLRRLPRKTVRC